MFPKSANYLKCEVIEMLKKILTRALVTAPVCMVVSQIITIIISHIIGDGRMFPVTPAFAALFKSETTAVIVQSLLVGLIGATFAGCSVIFDMERWSYLKQGVIHLAITSSVLVSVCLICWRPINRVGIWIMLSGWIFTYFCTWMPQYFIYRHNIRRLNEKIQSMNRKENA